MARKVKLKPRTPAQIAADSMARRRLDFGAVGLQTDAADLEANEDVEIEREGQKNAERARRADAFDALKPGMAPGAYDAARRLEHDYRVRYGETGAARSLERVDCTAGFTSDAMIVAAQLIDKVMAVLPLRDGWLLRELIVPVPSRPTWRAAVAYITGEQHAHGQGAAVRAACVNLRDAYAFLDRKPKMQRLA